MGCLGRGPPGNWPGAPPCGVAGIRPGAGRTGRPAVKDRPCRAARPLPRGNTPGAVVAVAGRTGSLIDRAGSGLRHYDASRRGRGRRSSRGRSFSRGPSAGLAATGSAATGSETGGACTQPGSRPLREPEQLALDWRGRRPGPQPLAPPAAAAQRAAAGAGAGATGAAGAGGRCRSGRDRWNSGWGLGLRRSNRGLRRRRGLSAGAACHRCSGRLDHHGYSLRRNHCDSRTRGRSGSCGSLGHDGCRGRSRSDRRGRRRHNRSGAPGARGAQSCAVPGARTAGGGATATTGAGGLAVRQAAPLRQAAPGAWLLRAAASCSCFLARMAFITSPGLETCERSIFGWIPCGAREEAPPECPLVRPPRPKLCAHLFGFVVFQ